MRGAFYIISNDQYHRRPQDYPKATAKLDAINRTAAALRQDVRTVWLDFKPDSDGNVLQCLTDQIRAAFAQIAPGASFVTVMGDSGTGPCMRAMQVVDEELGNTRRDRLFVAPGGTMNLIASALGSDMKSLPDYLCGGNTERDVVLRDLEVTRKDGRVVSFPWAAFASYGLDARTLRFYEHMSRKRDVHLNVIAASMQLAPDVLLSDEPNFWDMCFSVPRLGLINLDSGLYNGLHRQEFYRLQLGPVSGVGAALRAGALHFAGLHPAISQLYWERADSTRILDVIPGHQGFRQLLAATHPRISNGHHKPHPVGTGPFSFQVDGFPHEFPEGVLGYNFVTNKAKPVRAYAQGSVLG